MGARVRSAAVVAAVLAVLLVGQLHRALRAPDDLRVVEVGREMWRSGDYLIPHLAGLPFVEKPSGFPAVLAVSYAIAGRPSRVAARVVVVLFCLLSLLAVYLLGRRALGKRGALLALVFFGLSLRFVRTSHEILLDNALTAALAFALLGFFAGVEESSPGRKRWWYSFCAFCLAAAFLFKGPVGPVVFDAGVIAYLGSRKGWGEFRHILGPVPVLVFLVPVLGWAVPFALHATAQLRRAFFLDNQIGRAALGYHSNVRPAYFYLVDVWAQFLPGSVFLPFAAVAAFRRRRGVALFFLSFALAAMVVLSISAAKDSVYLLPAYAPLALLVAWWFENVLDRKDREGAFAIVAFAVVAALCATAAVAATVDFGGGTLELVVEALVVLVLAVGATISIRRSERFGAFGVGAILLAVAGTLFFTGPIARRDEESRVIEGPVKACLRAAGSHTLLLFRPGDGLRGAAGFYRDRTALEVRGVRRLLRRAEEAPGALVLLKGTGDLRALRRRTEELGSRIATRMRATARGEAFYLVKVTPGRVRPRRAGAPPRGRASLSTRLRPGGR